MNLHGIVNPIIQAVNSNVAASIKLSTGSTNVRGVQTPTYARPVNRSVQVQPLQYRDISQADGMNLQGTRRSIYVYGRLDGLVRSQLKGGDLLTIASGVNRGTWLVAFVGEQWPDWCRVVCTLQNE